MRVSRNFGVAAIVVLVLAAELLLLGDELEYRRSLLAAEPWRLLTGHFVHLSLLHAVLNCIALLLVTRLFADRLSQPEMFGLLALAPILISLAFWIALPELRWYRGLSGTLHALFFAGCVVWATATQGRNRWLPLAVLVGGILKIVLEQPWDSSFPMHAWLGAPVVPQAHLVGAVVGVAAALGFIAGRRSRGPGSGWTNETDAGRRNPV